MIIKATFKILALKQKNNNPLSEFGRMCEKVHLEFQPAKLTATLLNRFPILEPYLSYIAQISQLKHIKFICFLLGRKFK